jgi:ParB family chromosome partitioning protein
MENQMNPIADAINIVSGMVAAPFVDALHEICEDESLQGMAKELKLNLPSANDLFSTQEERDDAKLERVANLSLSEISDFPNHPFKVRLDAEMTEMAESVKKYGVLVPGLVRPKDGGGYEMVAGHRRKMASELAERGEMPCIVRNLTDDEATIIMVDSNLQRERILPSEKAFAYKMKLDAMKRKAGRPSKENSATVLQNFEGKSSRELLAEKSPDSHEQIRKYICLTELLPELLQMVDNAELRTAPCRCNADNKNFIGKFLKKACFH